MTLRHRLNEGYPLGAATKFSPPNLPGLALWLDSAAVTTLFQNSAMTTPATSTNDPVGAWADRSGNGRHATQATSTQRPLLDASRRLVFDGIDDSLTLSGPGLDLFRNRTGVTVFGVVSAATNQAARQRWLYASTPTAGNPRFMAERLTSNIEGFQGRRLDADATQQISAPNTSYSANTLTLLTVVADYAGDSLKMYKNGALGPNSAAFETGSTGQPTADTASAIIALGSGNASTYLNGTLAEIIVYSRSLSDLDRQTVEAYLTGKWAIV